MGLGQCIGEMVSVLPRSNSVTGLMFRLVSVPPCSFVTP